MITEKAIAVVTLHDMDKMRKKERSKIATWLRRQADTLEKEGGPQGKMANRYRARYLVGIVSSFLMLVLISGCVTTYEDIHSDFHTVQNGPMCYTVAQDERKFNSPTMVPPPLECPCSQLVSVKRLSRKAHESPEAWSCPMPVNQQIYNTSIVPAGHITYHPSLASTYIPAAGNAAIGAGIGGGLAAAKAASMTQSVTGSPVRTSTLLINAPVPGGVAP